MISKSINKTQIAKVTILFALIAIGIYSLKQNTSGTFTSVFDKQDSNELDGIGNNHFSLNNGLLTARWSNRSLKIILAELATSAGIPIKIYDSVTDIYLTKSFVNMPLDKAIRELALGHDVKILYGGDKNGNPKAIWVGKENTEHNRVSNPDVVATNHAMSSPISSNFAPVGSQDISISISEIQNENQRYQALETAIASGTGFSDASLKTLFLNDTSEHIRLLALRTLVDRLFDKPDEQRELFETALHDASQHIQEHAKQQLMHLEISDHNADIDEALPSGSGYTTN
jgi:hypothetical protein